MVIQVLNPKLGITLRVSITSAIIVTAKRTIRVSYRDALRPCSKNSSGDLKQWHIKTLKNPSLKLCFN